MDGSGSLQSGFVLAALVAAVLFVERLGGADELVRRLFQVSLAAAIAFAVISGTGATIRPPDYPDNSSGLSGSSSSSSSSENKEQRAFFEDLANRNAAVTSIHFGLGVAALIAGILLLRRRATIALAFALGGLLLVLFGGVASSSDSSNSNPLTALFSVYAGALGGVIGKGSIVADCARFGVFAGGVVVLTLFGLWKWDTAPATPSDDTPRPSE